MATSRVENTVISRSAAIIASTLAVAALFALYNSDNSFLFWFEPNPYALLSLVPFIANCIVFIVLVRRPARTDERTWLALYVLGICVWSLTECLQRVSITPSGAIFWAMLSGITIVIMASAFYLFALAYTSRSEIRHTGTIVGITVAAVIIGFFYGYTEIIFKTALDSVHLYPWGYNNDAGPGLTVVLAWLNVMYILGMVRLGRFRRHTTNPILRKQSLIFILSVAIPLVVGSATDGILPALGINTVPPLAMLMTTGTSIVLTLGVLRYKLLTINPILFSETILSIMHEAVVVTDEHFTILYTNAEAKNLLGLSGTAVKQPALLDFLRSPEHQTALQAAYTTHPATIPPPLEHIDISGPHNRKVPVRVTNSRLPLEGLTAYVMVLADISAELESKAIIEHTVQVRTKELHEARAYLLASINSLGQGFVLVDGAGRIEITNHAAERSLSRAGVNMSAGTFPEAVSQATWDIQLAPAVQTVLNSRKSRQMRATVSDGSFYDLYLTPVLAGNQVIGATILIEDVTEQRILERSRDEFFSIASHELRTPLTAIRGNSSMVLENFQAAKAKRMFTEKEALSMLDDIHSSSVRLIEIVNDFLDSSRLEQGKMEFALEGVDIKPVIESVTTDLERAVNQTGNRVVCEGLDQLPSVYTDRNRFKQIVYNLLSNAFKFTQHGTITVAARVVRQQLELRITDSGAGITPANQKLLFHKFQQAGDSLLTRDTSKGTGLGLYISRLLAENMDGSLELERSEPGKGSTFLLTLPVAKPSQLSKPAVTKISNITGSAHHQA